MGFTVHGQLRRGRRQSVAKQKAMPLKESEQLTEMPISLMASDDAGGCRRKNEAQRQQAVSASDGDICER
jgi:hypothetical protein